MSKGKVRQKSRTGRWKRDLQKPYWLQQMLVTMTSSLAECGAEAEACGFDGMRPIERFLMRLWFVRSCEDGHLQTNITMS